MPTEAVEVAGYLDPIAYVEAPKPRAAMGVDGAMRLAGAAGCLWQTVTRKTVEQLSDAEKRAWVAFARALRESGVIL